MLQFEDHNVGCFVTIKIDRGEGEHEGLDLALHQPRVWYGHHVLFAQHTFEWFVIYG